MQSHRKTILLGALPLVGILWFPVEGTARDDSSYEREEQRAAARLSERDQKSFDAFLNSHWETANELYRDPELINNERFLRGHSELRDWLEDHREAADAIRANPRAAIWQERTAGRRAEEERRPTAAQMSERDLRSFDAYLDAHDETAELLYEKPELINDRRFVREHEALSDWLENHPDAAEAIQANPQKFLWRDRKVNTQDFLRQLLR
jgi:hypothetical protein